MRALTIRPKEANTARLEEVPAPAPAAGSILVRSLALGICGTDSELIHGHYGAAPAGEERLILGHESLGRVERIEADCGLRPGDLVVGIVREPDPVPCTSCAVGEWDMCRNGRFTEHGIKELHGFGAEHFVIAPRFLVPVPESLGASAVLVEPTSVVAKAWEQIERVGRRAHWEPRRVLITGAGPVGLLAALLGAQRGLEVHVFDRHQTGPKPDLTRALGGTYHSEGLRDVLAAIQPDIILECTGAPPVILDCLSSNAAGAVICLLGISPPGKTLDVDLGNLNRTLVLENDLVFGSVNANRRHYEAAVEALSRADPAWLSGMITRRVPLERWSEALERQRDDVKVVIEIAD